MMKLEDYLEATPTEEQARLSNAEAARLIRFMLARKFRKIRRSLKQHPRFLMAGLAVAVLTCALTLWLLFGTVPADPGAINRPVYEPIVNGKQVTLEIIHLNGQSAPPAPMKKALAVFKTYLAGELKVIDVPALERKPEIRGRLRSEQVANVLARVKNRTPSTITLILAPDAEFNVPNGAIAVTYLPGRLDDYNGNTILVSARACAEVVKRGLGTEESVWYRTILHELCHTLNVPARGNHCWSGSATKNPCHCTNPSCILYPSHDRRMAWANFWRLGRTYELCPDCQREIRQAQAAAHGKLIETITPRQALLDQIKATLALNPKRAEADDFCGSDYARLKDYPQAMESYTKAIELNPNGASFYYHRGLLLRKQEKFDLALRDFDRAVELEPRNAAYSLGRGATYYQTRAYGQAIYNLKNACGWAYTARQWQTYALAQNDLAWYLATCPDASCRNGNDAVELATTACKMTAWEKPSYLGTLAAAYAEDNQYGQAVEYQAQAIALESGRIKSLHQELLALYRAGKPYRETPEEGKKWRTEENSTSASSPPID